MIKSGLKLYRNNLWEVFAIMGFIFLGILIGVFAIYPYVSSLLSNTVGSIGNVITRAKGSIDLSQLSSEITKKLAVLDWANPIRTINNLFQNNGFYNIVMDALVACKIDPAIIQNVAQGIQDICHDAVQDLIVILIEFIAVIFAAGVVGYLGTRIVVQARSTSNNNVLKFIVSFLLNILILLLVLALIILGLFTLTWPAFYASLVGIFLLMLLLSLLVSVLIYKDKNIKFREVFNLKSIGSLILTSLIITSISMVVVIIIFIFSDLIAILIGLPLLIINNIVIENIAIKYVTSFKRKKLKS